MKRSIIVTLALVLAIGFAPHLARAASNADTGATVCGRVDAPQQQLLALALAPGENRALVVARSTSETVQTTVSPDGSYCFHNLHADLHTIVAFGDEGVGGHSASVVPIQGETTRIDL